MQWAAVDENTIGQVLRVSDRVLSPKWNIFLKPHRKSWRMRISAVKSCSRCDMDIASITSGHDMDTTSVMSGCDNTIAFVTPGCDTATTSVISECDKAIRSMTVGYDNAITSTHSLKLQLPEQDEARHNSSMSGRGAYKPLP